MKIAQVSPYDYGYPGGVNAHIAHLEREFTRMGHTVKIIAPCSHTRAPHIGENFIRLGTPIPVPSGGSMARITLSLVLSNPVKAMLKREGFDIIHLHEPLTPMLPIVVLRFSDSPNVGTFHAFHGKPRGYCLCRPLLMPWFCRLHGLIAVSTPAMEFVSQCFPGNYRIIPNGIDARRFSPHLPPIPEFCDGKLNILFVGRLEKRKGLSYLLRAYGQVKEQLPHSRLIVVGPDVGWRRRHLKLVKKLHLKDIVFTGYVSQEDLPRYYRTAHVFCSPATGHESFGIVLLEAMASGIPIVASHIPGYAAVLDEGVQGLLVPPRDEHALAQALISLLNDPSRRQEMGARARPKAEEYSWERVAQRVMDFYLDLLGQAPSIQTSPTPPTPVISSKLA